MSPREKVYELLDLLNIDYRVTQHPAVFTIEDIDKLSLLRYGHVCKNLFLRDAKGRRHFLVVLCKDKIADLKSIQEQLGCSRLSFASEERLKQCLGLHKGEVSPMGIINDEGNAVEVVLDKNLAQIRTLGFHPNANTATVWISYDALIKIIENHGNMTHYVTI
jgi:Ala-tRNA(Pro) deacylase